MEPTPVEEVSCAWVENTCGSDVTSIGVGRDVEATVGSGDSVVPGSKSELE